MENIEITIATGRVRLLVETLFVDPDTDDLASQVALWLRRKLPDNAAADIPQWLIVPVPQALPRFGAGPGAVMTVRGRQSLGARAFDYDNALGEMATNLLLLHQRLAPNADHVAFSAIVDLLRQGQTTPPDFLASLPDKMHPAAEKLLKPLIDPRSALMPVILADAVMGESGVNFEALTKMNGGVR